LAREIAELIQHSYGPALQALQDGMTQRARNR
jgi:hypothetical protein